MKTMFIPFSLLIATHHHYAIEHEM